MATISTDLRAHLESTGGLPVLGYTVLWHLVGATAPHTDVLAAFDAAGWKDLAPDEPSLGVALKRAVAAWVRQRSGGPRLVADGAELADDGSGTADRALIRTINRKNSTWLAYALIVESIDLGALGLSHATDLRILLNKEDGTLVVTTEAKGNVNQALAESYAIQAELKPIWQQYRELLMARDVSRALLRVLHTMNAATIREGGGTYFVPATADNEDRLGRLRGIFGALDRVKKSGSPFLLALPQIDVAGARQQLAHATHKSIEAELAETERRLQRILDAEAGSVRPSTLTRQLAEFRQLREKTTAYAELLGMRQDTITATLDKLTAQAKTVILKGAFGDEDADDDEAPAPAPAPAEAAK